MELNEKRQLAREVAMSYIGTFYIWGGDDPSGMDCSGFAIEILKSVGLFPSSSDTTAKGLFLTYIRVDTPKLGCLVFYGKGESSISHVEFCLNDVLSIGASGGTSRTRTVKDAIRDNAFIKIRPMNRRSDVVGYVDPFKE